MNRALFTIAFTAGLAACGGGSGGDVDGGSVSPDGGSAVTIQPTYTDISDKIFVKTCSTGGCHDGTSNAASGLSLTKANGYAALVGKPTTSQFWGSSPYKNLNRVTASDASKSALLFTLKQPNDLSTTLWMPQAFPKLSASAISAVETWIANGAPNN